mgnify:CR=1 FL=1
MTQEDRDFLWGLIAGIVFTSFCCCMLFFKGILPDSNNKVYEGAYKVGQIDALKGIYKYKLELDTVIVEIIEK